VVNGSAPSVGDCKNIIGSLLIALGELNGSAPPIGDCKHDEQHELRIALYVERLCPACRGLQGAGIARRVGVTAVERLLPTGRGLQNRTCWDARCAFRAVERLRPARRGLQDLVGKLNGYILEVERLRPARKGLQEEAMARKVGVSLR